MDMATVGLTEGAIVAICGGNNDIKPVLQVSDIRLVNTQNPVTTTERYRLLLSDGVHLQQGMLATQHNSMVKNGLLQKGSLLLLSQFVCNKIQQRMIIIMVELEVLQETCPVIGEPKLYVPNAPTSEPPSVAQPQVTSGHAQYGNPLSSGHGSTYSTNESGRLPQPKLESGPQIPSYNRSSEINSGSGRYGVNNGVTGNVNGGGAYGGFNNAQTNVSRAPSSTYAQPQQSMHQQQQVPSMYTNRGPVSKNEAPPRIVPIAALNPYQGRWTIKARVTAKGELRHYNNAKGEGKVFNFDLLDSDGGEIRVTCFNAVADQFYDVIEVGKVYLISKGSLRPAQKNFNHLPNDHEIVLDVTSVVQPCYDDDSRIPRLQFNFRPISDVEGMDNNSIIDVIGVVSSISPTATIMRKNGTETQKRSLQLRDRSGKSVELTMWGNFCNAEGQTLQNSCDSGNYPVLALKAARISEFNGKALGTISSSQLFIEPDNPEARELKVWFDREGINLPSVSISREVGSFGRTDARKTISQIKDENLGTSEKPDWITVCATLSFMKMDNFFYTACPIQVGERQCNKKVTNNGDGKWRCDKCDQSVDECDYRYILQFQIQDHTGLTWVTAFQECGEQLLGMSAKELFDLKFEKQDDEKFQETVRAALFQKYIFKLKVKEETFNDEQRVKSTLVKAEKLNFATESKFLSDMLLKLRTGDSDVHVKAENVTPNVTTNRSGISHVGVTPSSNSNTTQYGNQPIGGYGNPNSAGREMEFGNQYSGGYNGASGSGMYATCTSCGGTGHSSTNCPSIASGPGQTSGSVINPAFSGANTGSNTLQCYKCQKPGHFARDCPGLGDVPSNTLQCYKCQKPGHFARDCPGLGDVPPAYGGNNFNTSRYGGAQKQHVGQF